MQEVRVQSWPLALIGSLLVHGTVVTGLYVVPSTAQSPRASASGELGPAELLTVDTAPLYILPEELPPDVAEKLAKDRERAQQNPPPPEPAVKPEPPKPPQPEPLATQLGDPDAAKKNVPSWIKNDSPLEHGARMSEVDQPALDRNVVQAPLGDPGQNGQQGKNAPSAQQAPAPEAPAQPTDQPPPTELAGPPAPPALPTPRTDAVKAEQKVEASVGPESPPSPLPEGPIAPAVEPGNSGGETPREATPATAPAERPAPREAQPAVEPSPAATPAAAQQPVPPTTEAPGLPGAPGAPLTSRAAPSDRESDAASTRRSAVFRNGKVEAGEGLELKTYRPEFNLTTRALLTPRSPTLEILFGKDGKAKRVRVLKSSGYPTEVDGPVVSALYRWRARGKLLDDLPAGPEASVTLEITVILQ